MNDETNFRFFGSFGLGLIYLAVCQFVSYTGFFWGQWLTLSQSLLSINKVKPLLEE